MARLDVRRLAAVDMHGVAGTGRRRRLILAEFVVGAVGGIAVGSWVATGTTGVGWRVFGAWLVGIGVNYVAVALRAVSLSPPGALEAELAGVDVGRELRRYSALQFWLFVPLALAILAIRQIRR